MNVHEINVAINICRDRIRSMEQELTQRRYQRRQDAIDCGALGLENYYRDPIAENLEERIRDYWQEIDDLQKKLSSTR